MNHKPTPAKLRLVSYKWEKTLQLMASTNNKTITSFIQSHSLTIMNQQKSNHTLRQTSLNWSVSPVDERDRISWIFCLNNEMRMMRSFGDWCTTGRLTPGGAGAEPVPGQRRRRRRWREHGASRHPNEERRRAHRSLLCFHLQVCLGFPQHGPRSRQLVDYKVLHAIFGAVGALHRLHGVL